MSTPAYTGPANFTALNELIRSSGLSYKENSKSWIFTCPKCEKPDKLYMFKDTGDHTGRFVCWVCKETEGFMGRPEYALRELIGMPLSEIKKRLYGFEDVQGTMYLNVQLKDFYGDDDPIDEDAGELDVLGWPSDYYPIDHKFAGRGLAYLNERGVSVELAQAYDVRYSPPERRVIFPIKSDGYLFGWQARLIEAHEIEDPETGDVFKVPKITTPKGVKKDHTLMFLDRLTGSPHAVLTEGPFDGIKAHLCGGNVASMGKAVSRQQIAILRNSGIKRVYVGLDPDAGLETLRMTREFFDLECRLLLPEAPYEDLGASSCDSVFRAFLAAPRINNAQIFAFIEREWEVLSKRLVRHQRILLNRRNRGAR